MSSILKALKKLEQEKSRRQEGSMDLARDILRGDVRRLGLPLWVFPVGAALLLAGVAVVGYHLVSGPATALPPPTVVISEAPAAVEAKVANLRPAVRPAYEDAVVLEEVVDSRRPAAPVSTPAARPAPPPAKRRPALTPAPHPVSEVPREIPPPLAPVRVGEPLPPATAPAMAAVATAPVSAPTSMEVTAIVFQEDREARLAVVNDLPVMEGTYIGEARVEEILVDRVIFFQDGNRFAAILNLSQP